MNAYCLLVFELVLYLEKHPWDLHNLLLPLIKILLIVTVGHAPKAPTQNPRVLVPQNYKSWIMIDWKILTSPKLFPSLGSQALFSQLVTQEPKKQWRRREFFLGGGGGEGWTGNMCSCNIDAIARTCSPGKFWKFKYSRMQSSATWTLKFGQHQDFIVVKKVRKN